MSSFALTLVFVSTFMHAGWNLLARRQRSETVFIGRMLLLIAMVGFLPAVFSELQAGSISFRAWWCLFGSGICCAIYFFCLGKAYESSDFTIVYPVARALPVLLLGFGDILRGRSVTVIGWVGMTMVACGCFLVPLQSFGQIDLRRYFHRSSLWMVLTALGTVGYSFLDKIASEVVVRGPATAARYGYMFYLFTCVFYFCLTRLFGVERGERNSVGWKRPFAGAFMSFGAYWLVLWAFQLTQHVSYVTAFRQFSIIIGVVIAFTVYREKGLLVRLTGAIIITAGLMIIGIWG